MAGSRSARIATALFALATLLATGASAQEGTEIPVRTTANAFESKFSKSNGYAAWAQTTRKRPNRGTVYVKPEGSNAFKIDANGAETTMGSLDGDRLVYQRYTRGSSNIMVMNLDTRRSRGINAVNTKRWEFWPRADGPWVMFGRRVSGQKQKLLLVNTKTGASRVLDTLGRNAYLLPGQVNGDFAVWNVMGSGKAKIKRHRISTRNTVTLPGGGRYNWGPSVTDSGTTYFGRSDKLCGGNAGLFRASLGGDVTKLTSFPAGEDMGTSWAYETPEGKIEVFHDRAECSRDGVTTADIFKVIDPSTVTLTVAIAAQGNATGSVTGRGINCGTECTQDFEPGDRVTLTAVPAEGNSFEGWSEASCGTELTCTVTVDADMTVTANFGP